MADKGLNLFDECAAEYVHMCPQEEACTSPSWGYSKMYITDFIANPQRTPTKINKNGIIGIAKVRVLAEEVIQWGIERYLE